ncbi:MAG: hypothetical protein AAFU61_14160, partial [Pseudomonadota bacterium]
MGDVLGFPEGGGAPPSGGAPAHPPRSAEGGRAAALGPARIDEERAWAAAAAVPDPEIPCVTVADLGILR